MSATRLRAGLTDVGVRLDQYLAAKEPSFTRSRLKKLIDDGHVLVRGAPQKAGYKLRDGDEVVLDAPDLAPLEAQPEDIPLSIVYQDQHLIAIDKPPGLVVHPAAGHDTGTLVNALLHHVKDLSGIGGVLRPGIVHRLDKDTSGVLVVSKSDAAHLALSALFKAHTLERRYTAIILGAPKSDRGTIETLYGRHPIHRKKFSSKVKEGKRAVTHYRVLERLGPVTVVELRLETGRTHQIRVHMADAGHPVLADSTYGKKPKDEAVAAIAQTLGRQALHAGVLVIDHPITGTRLDLQSPLPADITQAIEALRGLAKAGKPVS